MTEESAGPVRIEMATSEIEGGPCQAWADPGKVLAAVSIGRPVDTFSRFVEPKLADLETAVPLKGGDLPRLVRQLIHRLHGIHGRLFRENRSLMREPRSLDITCAVAEEERIYFIKSAPAWICLLRQGKATAVEGLEASAFATPSGFGQEEKLRLQVTSLPVRPGDVVVLLSSDMNTEPDLRSVASVFAQTTDLKRACDGLVNLLGLQSEGAGAVAFRFVRVGSGAERVARSNPLEGLGTKVDPLAFLSEDGPPFAAGPSAEASIPGFEETGPTPAGADAGAAAPWRTGSIRPQDEPELPPGDDPLGEEASAASFLDQLGSAGPADPRAGEGGEAGENLAPDAADPEWEPAGADASGSPPPYGAQWEISRPQAVGPVRDGGAPESPPARGVEPEPGPAAPPTSPAFSTEFPAPPAGPSPDERPAEPPAPQPVAAGTGWPSATAGAGPQAGSPEIPPEPGRDPVAVQPERDLSGSAPAPVPGSRVDLAPWTRRPRPNRRRPGLFLPVLLIMLALVAVALAAIPGGPGKKILHQVFGSGQAPTGTGGLFIAPDPPAKRVLLDGAPVAQGTPFKLTAVAAGRHRIGLDLGPCGIWETDLQVEPGQETRLAPALTGSIVVRAADPSTSGKVWVDGRPKQDVPATLDGLPVGWVRIFYEDENFPIWDRQVLVRTDRVATVIVPNQVGVGEGLIKVESLAFWEGRGLEDSQGDSVWVDDSFAGVTPYESEVAPGLHSVRVQSPFGETHTEMLELRSRGTRYVVAQFGMNPRPILRHVSPGRVQLHGSLLLSMEVENPTDGSVVRPMLHFPDLDPGANELPLSQVDPTKPVYLAIVDPANLPVDRKIAYYFTVTGPSGEIVYSDLYSLQIDGSASAGAAADQASTAQASFPKGADAPSSP